jgi:hypothetical protein
VAPRLYDAFLAIYRRAGFEPRLRSESCLVSRGDERSPTVEAFVAVARSVFGLAAGVQR